MIKTINKKHDPKTKNFRQCIVNRKQFSKEQLYRLVVTKNGNIFLDLNNNLKGRGFYFLKENQTLTKILNTQILERELKRFKKNVFFNKLELLEKITQNGSKR